MEIGDTVRRNLSGFLEEYFDGLEVAKAKMNDANDANDADVLRGSEEAEKAEIVDCYSANVCTSNNADQSHSEVPEDVLF